MGIGAMLGASSALGGMDILKKGIGGGVQMGWNELQRQQDYKRNLQLQQNQFGQQSALQQGQFGQQEKVLQNQTQWKMKDLKAAGINPMAAVMGSGGGGQTAMIGGQKQQAPQQQSQSAFKTSKLKSVNMTFK